MSTRAICLVLSLPTIFFPLISTLLVTVAHITTRLDAPLGHAHTHARTTISTGSHNFRMNDTQDAAEYRTTTDDRDFWTKDPRSVLQTRVSGGKGESWISPRVYQTTAARRKMKGEAVGRAREILRKTWYA